MVKWYKSVFYPLYDNDKEGQQNKTKQNRRRLVLVVTTPCDLCPLISNIVVNYPRGVQLHYIYKS